MSSPEPWAHSSILGFCLAVRDVSLSCYFVEFPSAKSARNSVIVFFCSWLLISTSISASAADGWGTSCSSHSRSEHFRLSFPFRVLSSYFSGFRIVTSLTSLTHFVIDFTSTHKSLLFSRDYSMSLTVEHFSFIDKNFLAYLCML